MPQNKRSLLICPRAVRLVSFASLLSSGVASAQVTPVAPSNAGGTGSVDSAQVAPVAPSNSSGTGGVDSAQVAPVAPSNSSGTGGGANAQVAPVVPSNSSGTGGGASAPVAPSNSSGGVASAQVAQVPPWNPGVIGRPRSRPVSGFLGVSAVYSQIMGTEFNGRHVNSFGTNRDAFLPKLSGGFGIRPSAGVLLRRVLPSFSLSASFDFEYSKHQAISYNVGNSWYEHDNAKFYDLSLELRGLLDVCPLKPFVGIAPGYSWLSLPNGVTVTTINPETGAPRTSWSDVTLHGVSFEASAGVLYELFTFLGVQGQGGYRLHGLTGSSEGSLDGYGYSPGWFVSLGAVGML